MIMESFIAWLIQYYWLYLTAIGIAFITLYCYYKWFKAKYRVYLLENNGGVYNLIAVKKYVKKPEKVRYGEKTIILDKPTFFRGGYPVYVVDINNPHTLTLFEKETEYTSEDIDAILSRNIISQIAVGLIREKKVDIMLFAIGIISGICVGLILGVYLQPYLAKGITK